jgi:O-succinylbenzoic acid--CoA ligase
MHELSIIAAAREAPSRDCLVAEGRAWSFEDIAARTAAAIDALEGDGAAPGDRIALTPRADVSSAVWLYASFELGCPVVLLHPRLTARERALVLEEATPDHVISTDAPRAMAPARLIEPVPDDETLAIVYTSGSRGTPRGARLSRGAFIAAEAAHAANLGWSPDDRWLLTIPPAHVGGLSILTRCLIARRCVVLRSGAFDAANTIVRMERDSVTLLSVVPTMLHRLLQSEDPRWHPAPCLRAVLVGGAPFPDALREEASSRGIPVLGTYGCTEACSQVTTQSLTQVGSPGSGVPLSGIEVRIEGGEIQVRGKTLMDGYIGDREHGEPWTPNGWLRTGDLGDFADDGQLVIRGRLDDLILTGGENVAPQEVEAWLHTQPGIAGACVFGVADPEWGQRVVAAIVIEPSAYDASALTAAMKAELAAHKRPKALAVLETLPLNRSGKVDRAAAVALSEGRLRPI